MPTLHATDNRKGYMDGARAIVDLTGEYPVYPGHPLTVAWEIMSVFTTSNEALATIQQGSLNCPTAVADSRITGGGSEVRRACDLLRKAADGESAEELIRWADACWVGGQAGGHLNAIEPGLVQADKIKPLFAEKLSTWLAANTAAV